MAEGVLVLEPGDERAKKIGKAMANESATAILSALKGGDLTLSEISERMDQPMTTVKYHVENLLDAELIEVRKIKYSEKGREVKVYGASERLVIVAPSGANVKDTLLKYASVFTFLILATLAMVAISPSFDFISTTQSMVDQDAYWASSSSEIMAAGVYEARNDFGTGANQSYKSSDALPAAGKGQADNVTPSGPTAALLTESVDDGVVQTSTLPPVPEETGMGGIVQIFIIAFFLGGCLILGIMVLYEVIVWRKEKRFWDEVGKEEIRQKNNR